MSIREHALWKEIRPFVRVETYARDGGHENPRYRLEFKKGIPGETKSRWLAITVPCVACGRAIYPIRARKSGGRAEHAGHLYLAPACPLSVNVSCSRGGAVHREYLAIREDVEGGAS